VTLLAATLALLAYSGHEGGSLTHGAGYLTERLPAPFASWFAAGDSPAGDAETPARPTSQASVYDAAIRPILESRCVECHGPKKTKGELRLDSHDLLMEGGESGPAIVPGNPFAGELYRRIVLPADHDEVMPSKGDLLAAREIRLIEWWIVEGASAAMTPAQARHLPADVRTLLAPAAPSNQE
jgi:mono/diheme cytochrome c family protein